MALVATSVKTMNGNYQKELSFYYHKCAQHAGTTKVHSSNLTCAHHTHTTLEKFQQEVCHIKFNQTFDWEVGLYCIYHSPCLESFWCMCGVGVEV